MPSVGQLLINDVLPPGYQVDGPVTNKSLHDMVVGLAKKDPAQYVRSIMALKARGDEIATLEGVSVGLDDITPDYEARDRILKSHLKSIHAAKNAKDHNQAVVDAQKEFIEHTKHHPGSMTHMALSGSRGNVAQLMKIVTTPLAAVHPKHGVDPFLIRRSYAEGLTPAEYWTTMPEVRANEVAARISVSEPGEVAKVLVNNMVDKVVTVNDCGTTNGVRMSVDDPNVLDRHAQAGDGLLRNTLVTPGIVSALKLRGVKDLLVRSPMTCSANAGVCQMCMGHDEKGQLHHIGRNVGVRSAQALAEPLTQMALSSRHGTLTVRGKTAVPTGLKGVRQFLEVPVAFRHEALLAPVDGVVTKVEAAPQGGHYVWLGAEKLYAPPEVNVLAHPGTHLEAGDAITDGIPHPAKVVAHKGIGAGRAYFVDALHRIYANEGVNIDKKHLELLAKAEMNHVRLLEADPHHPEFLKGDIVNYNNFRDAYAKAVDRVPLAEAIGRRLGQELLHHTVGTKVTHNLAKELKSRGIGEIVAAHDMPHVEFVMKSFAQNPLLSPDWLGRLAHRQLKGTLQHGAQTGETSDIHGTSPIPAYAYGASLRHGPHGTY